MSIFITGCASLTNPKQFVSAAPLQVTVAELRESPVHKRDFIGSVAFDSASKCADFLNGVVISQAANNTNADVATTVLGALASVFKPISTVHGLAAASTIVSGTKSAFNNNYFNKSGFSAFQVALQSTYYKFLGDYLTALNGMNDDEINVPVEVTKLQAIHSGCSLAATESAILATLQQPNKSQTDGTPNVGTTPPGATIPPPAAAPNTVTPHLITTIPPIGGRIR